MDWEAELSGRGGPSTLGCHLLSLLSCFLLSPPLPKKIRTVELEGKTIKLQIVRKPCCPERILGGACATCANRRRRCLRQRLRLTSRGRFSPALPLNLPHPSRNASLSSGTRQGKSDSGPSPRLTTAALTALLCAAAPCTLAGRFLRACFALSLCGNGPFVCFVAIEAAYSLRTSDAPHVAYSPHASPPFFPSVSLCRSSTM